MNEQTPRKPAVIWWGRSDPAYSRNAVVRESMQRLGWDIIDYRPGLMQTLGLSSGGQLPGDASLVWVPCFRQRDVASAARFAKAHAIPLVFDPLISAYDKQVFERRKFAEGSSRAKRLLEWERKRFALADLIVADTEAHAVSFRESLGTASGRTAVVPVGADDALFQPQPARPTEGRRSEVLFYGSFIGLQGPEVIARAAVLCDAVDWCLLGDGPLRPACEKIAKGRDHLRFEPWIDYEDLPARIGQADILLGVFSDSAKAGRVVPNKVYQAMACARPVITRMPLTDAFPWGDEEASDSGVTLVPPNDPDALARAVEQLADDTSRMQAQGIAARKTFEHHGSIGRVTEAVAAVLKLATDRRAS